MLDNFRLPQELFQIQTSEDLAAKTEELNSHLEVVEKNLSIHLGQNFDKYNKAFDQFSGM
jgi:uncharacterized FlaG/YvyC family protein